MTVLVAATQHSCIAGNTLRSRNWVAYQTEYGFTTAAWVVWEGNRHVRASEPELPTLRLYRGSHDVAVRNNVFEGARYAVRLDGEGDLATPAHGVRLDGRALAPGVYLVRVAAGGAAAPHAVTVVR